MMAQGPEASLKATQGLPLSSCIFSEGRRPLRMGSNHVTMSESTWDPPEHLAHLSSQLPVGGPFPLLDSEPRI